MLRNSIWIGYLRTVKYTINIALNNHSILNNKVLKTHRYHYLNQPLSVAWEKITWKLRMRKIILQYSNYLSDYMWGDIVFNNLVKFLKVYTFHLLARLTLIRYILFSLVFSVYPIQLKCVLFECHWKGHYWVACFGAIWKRKVC